MVPGLGWGDCCRGSFICASRIRFSIRFGSRFTFSELAGHFGGFHSSIGLVAVAHSSSELGLGGYLAGRLRIPLRPHSREEVEFRDGIHGLLVWALAVLIGALLAVAVSSAVSPGRATDAKSSTASTAESLFALELDQLFRSDRKPTDAGDPELRAQAARIISSGLGHRTMAPEDRGYLVRLVETRTGLAAADAHSRVTQM
jgi:hypothetical protein